MTTDVTNVMYWLDEYECAFDIAEKKPVRASNSGIVWIQGGQNPTDKHCMPIATLQWGRIGMSDGSSFKDVRVSPLGATEWDWGTYGMSHVPGVVPAVIDGLIKEGCRHIIIGSGMNGRLQVSEATVAFILQQASDVIVVVCKTPAAISYYNLQVRVGNGRVGGVFHSTC